MDLLKNARIRVIDNWTTGTTTHGSNVLDASNAEDVTLILTVAQTTTITNMLVYGSQTTGSFAALNYNSTAITVSSTVTGGVQVVQILKNQYPYLKTFVNSTGIAAQGQVIAILTGCRNVPTTQVSTEVTQSFYAVTPTT